jgi:hypothetical protein
MITAVGIDRVVTVDLHADQIQGFFDIPVDNVYGTPLFVADIERQKHDDLMVVSPDVGGVVRARALAKQLNDADLAIIDKRRPKANESQVMHIIGEVEGRTCVLVDDIVDTAGTLCKAAPGPQGPRRRQGDRLLHPPGAVRPGHRQHQQQRHGPAGGHRHHPAVRAGPSVRQDPRAAPGADAGGNPSAG